MPLKTNIFLIFFKDIHLKSIIFLIFCPGLPLKTIIFAYLKRKSNSIFFSIIRLGLGCTFLTTKHLYLNWLTSSNYNYNYKERLRSTRSSLPLTKYIFGRETLLVSSQPYHMLNFLHKILKVLHV